MLLRNLHYKDILVIAAIVLSVAGYLAWTYLVPSPEDEIRGSLERLVEAAERAHPNALLAELAPEYDGELANREEMLELARDYLAEYGPTRATITASRVNVRGELALAEVTIKHHAENQEKWGSEAVSSWRITYAKYGPRWYIENLVPLTFMGHEMHSFEFRRELRQIAEEALDEATRKLAGRADRLGEEERSRLLMLQRRAEALAERYPARKEVWTLDDFEDGKNLWVSQPWAHPAELRVVDFEGSKRLKAVIGRSENEKAALTRRVLVNIGSRGRIAADIHNAAGFDTQVALAVEAQGPRGRLAWYESPPLPLPQGANESVEFDLLGEDFKTQRTQWEHTARIPDLSKISTLNIVVYTAQGGTFYIDNVLAHRNPEAEPAEGEESE